MDAEARGDHVSSIVSCREGMAYNPFLNLVLVYGDGSKEWVLHGLRMLQSLVLIVKKG